MAIGHLYVKAASASSWQPFTGEAWDNLAVAIVGTTITNDTSAAVDVGLRIVDGTTATTVVTYILPVTSLAAKDSIYIDTKYFLGAKAAQDDVQYWCSAAADVYFYLAGDMS